MARLPFEVSVETDRPTFPPVCVCCCEKAETEYIPTQPGRPQGAPLPEEPLAFPYCERCLAHFKDWQRHANDTMVAVNIGIWGLAIPMMAGVGGFVLAAGPAIALTLVYLNRTRPVHELSSTCAARGTACRAIWYRRSTYTFSFASEEYANAFREVNLSELTPQQ